MENNWAAEHLQTIRTLMERSAIYRRALAPISTSVGVMGTIASLLGWTLKIESTAGVAVFWMVVSLLALAGSFLLVRRQALKSAEAFWSPPTRRVAQAMLPPLLLGMILGAVVAILSGDGSDRSVEIELIIAWVWLYGLALHSAGFFMPRGMRLFAWLILFFGCILLGAFVAQAEWENASPHLLMGGIFGVPHLAYGIYLYFTENRRNET